MSDVTGYVGAPPSPRPGGAQRITADATEPIESDHSLGDLLSRLSQDSDGVKFAASASAEFSKS